MTQPLRVLLIDDNRSDRALVIRELQREFDQPEIQEASSSGEFNRAIAVDNFDVVVTDFQLRWTTGLDILETVKHHYPGCPVIMFTNTGTEEIAVEAMKMGLDDYIIKEPNRYIRVPASVRLALERRQAQQRAALLEIRLQGLLNQVKIGIFRSQPDGRLLETNPAFLELLGVESIAEANQLNLLDTRDCYVQLANLLSPQRQEREVQLQRRDRTELWALLNITLTMVDGATVVDGLLEDITERKQSEMALQQLNATLEARVQERTASLEAANQDLEEFAYSVSHDLGAPLRTIQRFAQVLLEDLSETLDANYVLSLQRIAANSQQLNTFITDLLSYSRLKQAEIALEPVHLSHVLADARSQLDSEIQARQAQIQIEEPLPIVRANRLILIQVLTNLLSNAVKFVANEAQPQVRVWAEPRGEQARLWIEDNGIGIAPDRQQQIFRPFTRLHSEEEYPGTGIGLAIAHKGIERMDGQVGVESQPGQGSRFLDRVTPGSGVPMSTENTILLVEDNPKDVFLIQRALRKAQIVTPLQVVSDGDVAVQYLSGKAPYSDRAAHPLPVVVLLDLKLPRRSGAEVLMWIRQQPQLKRLPVVVLTSSREYTDINRIYDLGANAYIVKPPDFDQLVDVLKTLNLHWITYNEKPQLGML